MFNKSYSNFVKASSPEPETEVVLNRRYISGEEARRIYLEEIKGARPSAQPGTSKTHVSERRRKSKDEDLPLTNKELFLTVQNNDISKLKCELDKYPDKINVVDDYGWSLLMIACQANSVDSAEELLRRGIDMSIRDKAGNSARSLVIKNKNYALVDVLLQYRETESQPTSTQERSETEHSQSEEYKCDICNKTFPDKEEHLSSTIHNIGASKGKKIPASYVIPASNRGYQLMLKGGWDRDSGLGRDGSGKKYPIKTVQKKDRKGLGHKIKHENKPPEETIRHKSRKMFADNYKKNRSLEINFRREFY
ncbi:G patch domain and ankyrin repeat-containing protein 1 homolog [Anticarsia gemmatalis]|uniref:G patch domain and ankyrin repeat-containing protein 1 homolog n=1 Tax=Anticarsia gemmatalis TaxID=129554 RepID=UPI003F76B88A